MRHLCFGEQVGYEGDVAVEGLRGHPRARSRQAPQLGEHPVGQDELLLGVLKGLQPGSGGFHRSRQDALRIFLHARQFIRIGLQQ